MLELRELIRAKAWEGVVDDPFPGRAAKPRTCGITMIIDKGLGPQEFESLISTSGDYIDYLKLAFGTSALYTRPVLEKKLRLARDYAIDIYPGGTFLEVAILQGKLERFVAHARELGFTALEVSDGTVPLDEETRRTAIGTGIDAGLKVITEVGKKDSSLKPPLAHLRSQMLNDLACGASYVIVEGRESGKGVGIYDTNGAVLCMDMEELVANVPDVNRIIWEAPLKSQQEAMIARFGCDVNLGNIPPSDILALEALRRGLRGDTLRLYLERRDHLRL